MYIYIYAHIYTYIHTYTYTHTCTYAHIILKPYFETNKNINKFKD